MSLSHDVVVLDRFDAERLTAESAELYGSLRRLESALRGSSDDAGRFLYGQVRQALGAARWVNGALAEAVS